MLQDFPQSLEIENKKSEGTAQLYFSVTMN